MENLYGIQLFIVCLLCVVLLSPPRPLAVQRTAHTTIFTKIIHHFTQSIKVKILNDFNTHFIYALGRLKVKCHHHVFLLRICDNTNENMVLKRCTLIISNKSFLACSLFLSHFMSITFVMISNF